MTYVSANDELFGRYLDGVADEGDIAALRERLLADAEAADSLVAIARFEALIHSHLVDTNRGREVECLLNADARLNELDVIPTLSPLPSLSTLHSPLSTPFVGGPVFSYMVASVVLCLMLLGAWAYKISHDEMVVQDKPAINSIEDSEYKVVGRVSDMKDCVWPKDGLVTMVGASVPMGRKYVLSSGLLEITYTDGAKVILEGPCEYTADSSDGGFLRVGKLVARVEKQVASGQWPVARKEGRGEREEGRDGLVASAASEKLLATSHWPLATDPQFPAPSPQPPLSTLYSPLFTITTPTAVVTDLGTEFGVAVDESGNTTSYVFRGLVKVRVAGDRIGGRSVGDKCCVVLRSDESARVKIDDTASIEVFRRGEGDGPPKFTRRVAEPPKLRAYAKMVLADAPLFYWTFDESAGAAIEQIRRLPHQCLYPLGEAGRCDHLAIDSGLALGRAADFSMAAGVFASKMLLQERAMPGAWAIEFWVQATGKREQGTGQYVMNAGIGARPPYFQNNPAVIFNWPNNAEKNELQLFYDRGGPTHGGPILADEKWHHVILAFYGNGDFFGVAPRVDVVVDGQPRTIDRGEFSAGFSLNGQICLGAAASDLSHAFRGRIDELAFYDLSEITVGQIENRIAELGRRHFTAARSETAEVGEAKDAPSNIDSSRLGTETDKCDAKKIPDNGKEHQTLEP